MTTPENEFELRLGRIGHERSSNVARVRATIRLRAGVKGGPKTRLAQKTGIRVTREFGPPCIRPSCIQRALENRPRILIGAMQLIAKFLSGRKRWQWRHRTA